MFGLFSHIKRNEIEINRQKQNDSNLFPSFAVFQWKPNNVAFTQGTQIFIEVVFKSIISTVEISGADNITI